VEVWGIWDIMAVTATGFVVFLGTNNNQWAIVGSGLAINESLGAIGIERATMSTDGGEFFDLAGMG